MSLPTEPIGSLPGLMKGPFRYGQHADSYLEVAQRYAHVPVRQAVNSPSALSLHYREAELPGYSRDEFIHDLLHEYETEVRSCLQKGRAQGADRLHGGAARGQARPFGPAAAKLIDLNNMALSRFSAEERQRIGVHTCPGGDRDSTHSAEEVRDRILQAAKFIPVDRLGTTDDCGFSPFCDDRSTTRDTAFSKIRARVEGTALASRALGVGA